MPPDTTRSLVEALLAPNSLLTLIGALIGIFGGLIGIITAALPWLKQWLDRRSLRRRLGAMLYTPEDIERATRHYIRPHCQSIDPTQGPEISGVYASREDLFAAIDRLLDQPAESKYLLLLADSGMGKTSFLLNYYARYLRRLRKPFHLQVIPTGIKDADARIQQIENKSDTVLFLDALDEDTLAIVDHRQRILDLCNLTREFRRVLMTCRTQFFPHAEEEPRRTGVVKLTSISAGREGEYIFHKLYLSPFDDGQVKKYLWRRYSFWRWLKRRRAREVADKIPQLTARPMLLAHIDDLLASGREFNYSFQLYEEMVEAWLTREAGRVEGLQKEPLREFCERLAIELFARRQAEGSERLPHDAIEPLAKKFGIKLEGWKLSGRSLLNRDAEDNFKFAHRSIMEYLFVKRFLDLPIAERSRLKWTDQMKRFLFEMIHYHWQKNRKVPFDLSNADLSELGKVEPKLVFKLRPNEKKFGEGEAKRMLKEKGFFDSGWNKDGQGIFHLYEILEFDGGKAVMDYATGLMWQQSGSSKSITYSDAENYIRELNAQRFAGYSDWRLPTLEEAMSLMEPKKHGNLYIDPVFDRQQTWIWTADKESAGRAWRVYFLGGYCAHGVIGYFLYVRAVRSGQSSL